MSEPDPSVIATRQRERRRARFRAAVAEELSESKSGAVWGAVAATAPGAFLAWDNGWPWVPVLLIAAALGAVAGAVFGPRVALYLVHVSD